MSQISGVIPGGGISRRPMHLFILADCSGSMKANGKMQALNFALASMLPHLAEWERDQEQAEVFVRVMTFGDSAKWVVESPVPLKSMRWSPLQYVDKGLTAMGAALRLLTEELKPGRLEDRSLRPVVLLITDGRPTDPAEFDEGLQTLLSTKAGRAAIRLAVAIGRGANSEYLARFVGDPTIPVLVAENAEQITDQLLVASLAMSRMSIVGLHDAPMNNVSLQTTEGGEADVGFNDVDHGSSQQPSAGTMNIDETIVPATSDDAIL